MWEVGTLGVFSPNGKRPCCADQIPCLGGNWALETGKLRVPSTLRRAQLRLLDVFYADVAMYTIYPI